MSIDRYVRLIAGFFIMRSLALGYWLHPAWFLFSAFVGATCSSPPSQTGAP
jgi:hypothetical protein